MLQDQALRAAKSVCLNLAEGARRVTRVGKARAYTVARGEFVAAVAANEMAAPETGDVRRHVLPRVLVIADELYAVLTKLVQ